ncbi:hypothetical protein [Methanoregula sp.]
MRIGDPGRNAPNFTGTGDERATNTKDRKGGNRHDCPTSHE